MSVNIRAYTEQEVQAQFIRKVQAYVQYWSHPEIAGGLEYKLGGLALSILALLDGADIELPGFRVSPTPHEDDRLYHQERGENWYPDYIDIAGDLHNRLYVDRDESQKVTKVE